jgi:acyl-CoA thioesterase
VRVTVGDAVIAEFRGHSRTIGGTWLPQPEADTKQK